MNRAPSNPVNGPHRAPPSGAGPSTVGPSTSASSTSASSTSAATTVAAPQPPPSAVPASVPLAAQQTPPPPPQQSPSGAATPSARRRAPNSAAPNSAVPRLPPDRSTNWQHRLRTRLVWLVALIVIAGLSVVALRQKVDDGIRSQFKQMLVDRYPDLDVRVDWGRRLGDRGIELRGVFLSNPALAAELQEVLSIERLELQCDASLPSLASGDIRVDHVLIDGLRLRGVRTESGKWSFTCLMPKHQEGERQQTPSIEVVDGEIELVDKSQPDSKLALWRDVRLHLSPASSNSDSTNSDSSNSETLSNSDPVAESSAWTFGGEMLSGRLGRTRIDGWMISPQEWHVNGRVVNLIVDNEIWHLLPDATWEKLGRPPHFGAKVNVDFRIDKRPEQSIRFAMSGKVNDGWLDDERIDYPLTALRTEFEFSSEHLVLRDFFARTGEAEIRGGAVFRDFGLKQPYRVDFDLRRFPVDQRLRALLTDRLRATWDKFQPLGRCGGSVSFDYDGERISPTLDLSCQDFEVTYHQFPYRLRGASGDVTFENDHLTLEGTVPVSGTTISITADLDHPGPVSVGEVTVRSLGHIPLDRDIIDAMPVQTRQVIAEINPRGWFKIDASFSRQRPTDPISKHFTIHVRDGVIEYAKFPYPVHHITGLIDVTDGRWSCTDIRGANGSGFIKAAGVWDPHAPDNKNFDVTLTCHDVPLDEELQNALPDGMKRLWKDLRPNGTVDYVKIVLGFDRAARDLSVNVFGQKWAARQRQDRPKQAGGGRVVSVTPSWFPYRFEDVTGSFHYIDGRITLRDVRGRHDRTTIQRVNGVGQVSRFGEWELKLSDLIVSDLLLDRDLMDAFPESVGDGLSRLRLGGPLGMQGSVNFAGGPDEKPETRWNLDFDMEDLRVECGPLFEHVRGQVTLMGAAGSRGFVCDGQLDLDSVFFKKHHLVNVNGPIRFDAQQVYLGSYATEQQRRAIPESVQARLLGGTLTVDAKVTARQGEMTLDAALESADLRDVSREFGLQRSEITGKTSVTASLVGKANDPQTWRGGGVVRLWDADLYESPFMVRLLSVLKYARFDKSAFSRSNMDYRVEGDRIVFDRVTLEGPIRLRGRGELTRQRQLDMNFYVELLDEKRQLPFLRPLAMGANKNALSIRVTGTPDVPIIVKEPFPDLNRGLQEIFVESGSRDGASRTRSKR